MSFETLSSRLQQVAKAALAHCRQQFGQNGIKIGAEIATDIPWQPTFSIKASTTKVIAVEVEDRIYPEILKIAAHDVGLSDIPIAVYQACSLEAYQTDSKHARVNLLRKHGFGIITVDDGGLVVVQQTAVPLAQFISTEQVEKEMSGLTPKLKVAFRGAHATYLTNEGQGLQQAGQIVEALIKSIAQCAEKENLLVVGNDPTAGLIDKLWNCQKFHKHRAALGGAREFVRDYRNIASHPAKSAKAAAEKIRRCRAGFLDGMRCARNLREVAKDVGYPIHLHVT